MDTAAPPGAKDPAQALAAAQVAIAEGGGGAAYAARADAEFALGRPMDQVIADYARAAALDPRYAVKYNGLVAQRQSEEHPSLKAGGLSLGDGANGLALILAFAAIGCLLAVIGLVMINGRKE